MLNKRNDLTFFTNEPDATLLDRFKATLKHVQFFDVLVGYFRTSGFRMMAESLASAEKIRILVGLNVDRQTFETVEEERTQRTLIESASQQARTAFCDSIVEELEVAPDTHETESGVRSFLAFLQAGKLEIRAHPSQKIHAKLYIQRFREDDRDFGRIITGSSNFSYSGLQGNYEFNVELKQSSDVQFALEKFEELWAEGIDVSEQYAETVKRNTWLNDEITPRLLYLKLLYEYFKEELNFDDNLEFWLPDNFMALAYQSRAVQNALRVLETYRGVFLADVVGLGKTFISALLAQQLPGRKLVICPPVLVDYWRETFRDFGVRSFQVESIGKLDQILQRAQHQKVDYLFIDEAHRFRNEMTQRYEQLAQICAGKKVILVSATPLNNRIEDIFSQLKLFQSSRHSTIPGLPNLEAFFAQCRQELAQFDRTSPEYLPTLSKISNQIRDKILKYVMVRRTRSQIKRHYAEDMEKQGLIFPDLANPHRLIYRFDSDISPIFDETLEKLKTFRYARYTPLLYLKMGISGQLKQGQNNIGGFMRMMLVKRLESSFYAFRCTLARFIDSYERFIGMVDAGTVWIGSPKVLDLFESDDDVALQKMVDEGEIESYQTVQFVDGFREALQADLNLLYAIFALWNGVSDDPKRDKLIEALREDTVLSQEKVIIFSESAETTLYLFDQLNAHFPNAVIAFTSAGAKVQGQLLNSEIGKQLVLNNFDPKAHHAADDIRILVTTDVLAEGINLHRSPVVINYDLPWNPTRVLQRVGRINRVGTKHSLIHIYNFFPTDQSDEQIGLEANIKSKIQAFHNMLGEDAKYLSDEEELMEHNLRGDRLVQRLTDRTTYLSADETERSEADYLEILREVRETQPELFAKLKRMPVKARSGWQTNLIDHTQTLTFFRQGRVKKFFLGDAQSARELTFFEAIDLLTFADEPPRQPIPPNFYDHLVTNKIAFRDALLISNDDTVSATGKYEKNLRDYLRKIKKSTLTDEDQTYLQLVLNALDDGRLPNKTVKTVWETLSKLKTAVTDPPTIFPILRKQLPYELLKPIQTNQEDYHSARREIILSAYLIGD